MWGTIHQLISHYIDQPFNDTRCRPVSGGDSHKAVVLSNGNQTFFIKINERSALPQFFAEVDGLKHLDAVGIATPKVVDLGTSSNHSFLILEHLELKAIGSEHWRSVGQTVAKLHQSQHQAMFGWQEDNFIGPTLQANQWTTKWRQFYTQQRVGCLLDAFVQKFGGAINVNDVLSHIHLTISGHRPAPSLLHGDLWLGNIGIVNDTPYLFDPAIYFGDREVDLAMSELFGRFPEPFYQAYHEVYPIARDYEFRKPIYQLYPLLNHALLFGGHYVTAVRDIISSFDTH